MRYRNWAGIVASTILGLIFIVAGVGKLFYQTEAFGLSFSRSLDFWSPAYTLTASIVYSTVELIVGLLLISGIAARLAAIFSSMLIAGFIINNGLMLSYGLGYKPCSCFGVLETIIQGRLSVIGALYLDIGMLALVFIAIFCYPGSITNLRPWFLRTGRSANNSLSKGVN